MKKGDVSFHSSHLTLTLICTQEFLGNYKNIRFEKNKIFGLFKYQNTTELKNMINFCVTSNRVNRTVQCVVQLQQRQQKLQ